MLAAPICSHPVQHCPVTSDIPTAQLSRYPLHSQPVGPLSGRGREECLLRIPAQESRYSRALLRGAIRERRYHVVFRPQNAETVYGRRTQPRASVKVFSEQCRLIELG